MQKLRNFIRLFFLALDLFKKIYTIELSKADRIKLSTYDKVMEKRIFDLSINELGKRLVIENNLSPDFVR